MGLILPALVDILNFFLYHTLDTDSEMAGVAAGECRPGGRGGGGRLRSSRASEERAQEEVGSADLKLQDLPTCT